MASIWKQRLYAFLLRRILGPYLSEASNRELHNSVEVSIQEGKFALKDVSLNEEYLNTLIPPSSSGSNASSFPIAFRRVRIRQLLIQLSIEETDKTSVTPDGQSKLTGVAVVAHVELDGVEVEIEPGATQPPASSTSSPQTDEGTSKSEGSMVSSYLDKAISSLRLSLQLSDICLRFVSTENNNPTSWIELRLASAFYHDVSPETDESAVKKSESHSETLFNKAIEFAGIEIHAGETPNRGIPRKTGVGYEKESRSVLGRTEGTGHILFRAVAHMNPLSTTSVPSENDDSVTEEDQVEVARRIQQDLDLTLGHRFNVSVDKSSLSQIALVAKSFQTHHRADENAAQLESRGPRQTATQPRMQMDIDNGKESDSADIKALSGMMKQYYEARELVESNQLRGGMLLPSSPDDSRHDNVDTEQVPTFDTFFDANDQSFFHYKSVLEESLVEADLEEDGEADFVHTRVKIRLLGGGIRVCLPTNEQSEGRHYISGCEYMLLTLNDIEILSSVSCTMSDASITVSHVEIEDSVLDYGGNAVIRSVLRFVQSDEASDADIADVLSQPSCVSLRGIKTKSRGHPKSLEVDLSLQPLDVAYRLSTAQKLSQLAKQFVSLLGTGESKTGTEDYGTKDSSCPIACFTCICPSITVSCAEQDLDHRKKETNSLVTENCYAAFDRCGYDLNGMPATRTGHVGVTIDGVSLEVKAESNSSSQSESLIVTCNNIINFVTYPSIDRAGRIVGMKRMDYLVLCGQVEIEPYAPISITYKRRVANSLDDVVDLGRKAFPIVPSLSAFKARQEDDDGDEDADETKGAEHIESPVPAFSGSHPERQMVADAEECDAVANVHIPTIWGDFSRMEASMILQMVESATDRSSETREPDSEEASVKSCAGLGIALQCDQICLTAHCLSLSDYNDSCAFDGGTHSYACISDGWKAFALIDESALKNVRTLVHDISLFEVKNIVEHETFASEKSFTVQDRCERVRLRHERNSSTSAVPIIYRSKLFSPISPESPSLLLDLLFSRASVSEPTEKYLERCVYLTLYNMTYRYDLESLWLERIRKLFQKEEQAVSESTSDEERPLTDEMIHQHSSEAEMTLTRVSFDALVQVDHLLYSYLLLSVHVSAAKKLFVSLADCNVDYTSSGHFKRASRLILRIGDTRLSSNLVSNSMASQALRLTINDVSTHLSNSRFPYCAENSRLLRASSLMDPRDIISEEDLQTNYRVAPETALQNMDFITVATLDSIDALLTIARKQDDSSYLVSGHEQEVDPSMTASLGVGHLCIYACQDSFGCLVETISDLQVRLTSLTQQDMEQLKEKSVSPTVERTSDEVFDPISNVNTEDDLEEGAPSEGHNVPYAEDYLNMVQQSESTQRNVPQQEFLLDGYDWTTVDSEWTNASAGGHIEEQSARWYSDSTASDAKRIPSPTELPIHRDQVPKGAESALKPESDSTENIRIIPQHIPLAQIVDPLSEGDMDAPKLAGTACCPPVQTRVLLRKFNLRCRLFDGYDWPMYVDPSLDKEKSAGSAVVGSENVDSNEEIGGDATARENSHRRAQLMGDLLGDQEIKNQTFSDTPLPEERGMILKKLSGKRRLARRSNRFIQASASGVKLRLDSFEDSSEHQLASCIDLTIADLFLAETISDSKPVKMLGEWVNDIEHPRDTNHGFVMAKLASFRPRIRVSDDGEIVPMRSRVVLELLPIRCLLDQRAIGFASKFFASEPESKQEDEEAHHVHDSGLVAVPPPVFKSFRVKQCKLKVDYNPEKIDVDSLRDGSYVELINLSPLNDMVITLQPVIIRDHDGLGPAIKELLGAWISDVISSQMYKFLANATPFQPISNVGGGAVDLVVLPWEAFRRGDKFATAVRSGARYFAETVAYETLNTTAKLTKYAADKLASLSMSSTSQTAAVTPMLPSRPEAPPRGVPSTTNHAVESIAHGISAAGYKVVVIPVREYRRRGAADAARSVARGIPVAIMAPISGASEAISYTLLGARNQIRPDIRTEEEQNLRGLRHGDL